MQGERHMTADIASLSPDELRRCIAERLGYTVVPYDDDINREDGFPESTWQVVDPGGRGSALPPDITALESAWECAMQPDFDGMSPIPDWPGDLNAAINLLPIQRTVSIGHFAGTPTWWCTIKRVDGEFDAQEFGEEPAMACARAALAWLEAHKPQTWDAT